MVSGCNKNIKLHALFDLVFFFVSLFALFFFVYFIFFFFFIFYFFFIFFFFSYYAGVSLNADANPLPLTLKEKE